MTFKTSMTRRALVCVVLATTSVWAQAQSIVMSSTTSTEQSGLFAHLLPAFKKASGIDVKVVALGTGQALDMARRGDADVVFVHDQVAEEKFVADGFGLKRLPVMYNDFVLIGPKADPAATKGKDIVAALTRLSKANGVTGKRPTWRLPKVRLTVNAVAAWGQPSTWRRPPGPMCCQTERPG
jgi:tungstate transport system substrate-binding protein